MARPFVELDEFHVGALHPLGKAAGNAREREHGVTPALGRHAIQQVDEAVFQPADTEGVHHVHDEGGGRAHLDPFCAATRRAWSIAGSISLVKTRKVSAAACGRARGCDTSAPPEGDRPPTPAGSGPAPPPYRWATPRCPSTRRSSTRARG